MSRKTIETAQLERKISIGPAGNKKWRELENIEKIFYYNAAILIDPNLYAAHISLNFAPSIEGAEVVKTKSIRTIYQKVLRDVLGPGIILDYINIVAKFKMDEKTGKPYRKLHLHGVVGVDLSPILVPIFG